MKDNNDDKPNAILVNGVRFQIGALTEFLPSRRPRRAERRIWCLQGSPHASAGGLPRAVQAIRLKSLCATASHASGEQGAPTGSPPFFRAKTPWWPAMPRPSLDSRIADIPSPSTSVPIAGRPCTGS